MTILIDCEAVEEDNVPWQDHREAHWFHTLFEFIENFKDDPELMVLDLLEQYPTEAVKLAKLLNKEKPGPIARLLQAYQNDV